MQRSPVRTSTPFMLASSLVLGLGGSACDLAPIESEEGLAEEDIAPQADELGTSAVEPQAARFVLQLSPLRESIQPGHTEVFTFAIESAAGFSGQVRLVPTASPALDTRLRAFPSIASPPDSGDLFVDTNCGAVPGDYIITITGTDDGGQSASASAILTVRDTLFPPGARTLISTRVGLTIRFLDVSSPGGCNDSAQIVERRWDFGDGATSTETNPTHTYAAPGRYTVQLTVTNSEGLSSSTTREVDLSLPSEGRALRSSSRRP